MSKNGFFGMWGGERTKHDGVTALKFVVVCVILSGIIVLLMILGGHREMQLMREVWVRGHTVQEYRRKGEYIVHLDLKPFVGDWDAAVESTK